MASGGYLRTRLSSLHRSRGTLGLLTFLASRIVRVSRDVVFRRSTEFRPHDADAPAAGRFVAVDRYNLDRPEHRTILDQVLNGEQAIYRIGLEKDDLLFVVADDDDEVLHHTFVQFESRYRQLLDLDDAEPMFTNCWTSPKARGHKLYPATLRYGCGELSKRGHRIATVTCAPDNTASIRGILHAGFTQVTTITSLVFLSRFAVQTFVDAAGATRRRIVRL